MLNNEVPGRPIDEQHVEVPAPAWANVIVPDEHEGVGIDQDQIQQLVLDNNKEPLLHDVTPLDTEFDTELNHIPSDLVGEHERQESYNLVVQ